MAYNTGNPVGSKDPRDLYDNATNFDNYAAGPDPFYPNRFGVLKLSIEGMNQQFDAAQTGRADQFAAALASIGFTWIGDYTGGLVFTTRQQYTVRGGIGYILANDTTVPYTSTGNWTTEQTKFKALSLDQLLRADLASTDPDKGAALVTYNGAPLPTFLNALSTNKPFRTPADGNVPNIGSATSSAATTAAWNAWVDTLLPGEIVRVSGTYEMDQGVQLAADNTTWYMKGSLLKLSGTQATDDFIVIDRPVSQRIYDFRFDANSAGQNASTFGIDNCGCIIISPNGFELYDTQIDSSPAKGLAVVSAAGETSRNWTIDGVTGGNCVMQAVLVDGNNSTGFFDGENHIDRICIGATTHAGLAINDGASNIQIGNVDCRVANTAWDAVSVRDSFNLQFGNVRTVGGRNGFQAFAQFARCRNIQVASVYAEGADQNGVAFFAVENVNVGIANGRNNAACGVNVGQRNVTIGGVTTLTRCKDITIGSAVGIDDRSTAVQQYGIIVGGADNATINGYIARGNTTRNVSLIRAAPNNNVRVPVEQFFNTAVPSLVASGSVLVTVNLPVAMDDAEYEVMAAVEYGSSTLTFELGQIGGKAAGSFQITVRNVSGATVASGATIRGFVRRRP